MSRKSKLFSTVPVANVKRNHFDLSHEVKMSGKFGYWYPTLCMDVIPGDDLSDKLSIMCRFAPMQSPVMHRCDVITRGFFVPYRLLTDVWEDFITGGQDGLSTVVLPYITPNDVAVAEGDGGNFVTGTLWDYLGGPAQDGAGTTTSQQHISALMFRAYGKIFNDWLRDPNLSDELVLNEELSGNVSVATHTAGLFDLRQCGWEKDFFTSALPWAQRGAEVLLPLAGTGFINPVPFYDVNSSAATGDLQIQNVGLEKRLKDSAGADITDLVDGMAVTLDESTVSINDFRRTMAIQKWMESNARGGGRYVDQIMSHFNVRVPDYRLQRSEYIGGGRQVVTISQVLATAASESGSATSIPGEMFGHGISVGKTNSMRYECKEHGVIIVLMAVMPRTAYQQGLDRMWTRESKFDFAFPELAHLGEQEILSKEVFYSYVLADDPDNNETFGYTPRYAEYKFKNDRVAGDFRTSLAFWHLGRIFLERPALDTIFTTMLENGSAEETFRRIFQVQDGTDYLWFQLFHNLSARRPLPYFGVPTLS